MKLTVVLALIATVYATEDCDRGASLTNTVQCVVDSHDGNWLLEKLGILTDVEAGVADGAFNRLAELLHNNEKPSKEKYEKFFKNAGGLKGVKLSAALYMDDALYGDTPVAYRNHTCHAVTDLLKCAIENGRACSKGLEGLVYNRLAARLNPEVANIVRENMTPKQLIKALDEIRCWMCYDDEKTNMEIVMGSLLDEEHRSKMAEFKDNEVRGNIYRNCAGATNVDNFPAAVDGHTDYVSFFVELANTNPCGLHGYVRCLADRIHNDLNPDDTNVIGGVMDILFHTGLNCADVPEPAELAQCTSVYTLIGESP